MKRERGAFFWLKVIILLGGGLVALWWNHGHKL